MKWVVIPIALLMFGSLCSRVSALEMGSSISFSSCDETQLWGRTGNDLFSASSARLACRLGRSLGLTSLSFLAVST